MELKEGMYVKTKWGYVCELININDFREPSMRYGVEASYLKDIMFIGNEDILKASNNIIDLIEEGDYVNGFRVNEIDDESLWCGDEEGIINFKNKDIKSIVTKEMYESMEYKVND